MTIKLHSDYSAIDKELDRVSNLPGPSGKAKLDAAHAMNFAIAQAEVDIDTSSLLGSGRQSTSGSKFQWEGRMSWGGSSVGVNNPVDYAIYELARGGGHDWLGLTLPAMHARMVAAIKGVLSK